MAPITPATPDVGETEVDLTVGFDDLISVLAWSTSIGLAVLVALAAVALWLTREGPVDEHWDP